MSEQKYRNPALTVDAVIRDEAGRILLIRRKHAPFAACWAMPGGFVDYGESCPDACRREVAEETGLQVEVVQLLDVLSEPGRDPRKHVVSVVYECRIVGGALAAGDDAAEALWFADLEGVELAFDHGEFLAGLG